MRIKQSSLATARLKADIRKLHARGYTDAEIAAALGQDRQRICQFRARMGLPCNEAREKYSPEEYDILRAEYGRVPAAALAKRFGRTRTSIYKVAARLGLNKSRSRLENRPGLVATLSARHAEGWSDAEIGRELGVDRHHVGALRKRIGLPPNTWSQHLRDRVRAKTAEQLAKAGLPNIGYLRVEAFKKFARDRGWPEDLKKRQVQILELLWKNGPMTREEICLALGLRKNARSRKFSDGSVGYWYPMHCNTIGHTADSSYTGDLLKRGLIISLGRIVRNKPAGAVSGQGRNTCLYSLPLDIERKFHVKKA